MTLAAVAVIAAGAAATVIDMRTRRVPNALTMGTASAGLVLAMAGAGAITVGQALSGLALGLALLMPAHIFGATGAGDVKLLAAAGALLGPTDTIYAFLYTAIAGGVLALLVAVARRRLTQTIGTAGRLIAGDQQVRANIDSTASDNRFAYAPAIAIGVVLVALSW
jgi:prepilin peptidase CpaA